ncbi:MAG TPA: methyltransferase domain-containing protein [Acidimicrobiales bacterium]|nr:methyltransferase domain-containing protein [Acidimicrobiales bacterium]
MNPEQTHALGYGRVDDDPNVSVLLGTMDETGRWEATLQLRRWEQEQLRLRPGQRLLDVGCGLGDAAVALAGDLGDTGLAVGVDLSVAMVVGARSRSRVRHRSARFAVGDAHRLAAPDRCFDVVRSERTLQWVASPETAVAEMVRVLRPGGLLSLIDTDWSTFAIDVGDSSFAQRVHDAMQVERRRPSTIGSRLVDLIRDAGLLVVGQTTATQRWTSWNPDESPTPEGCFSMSSLAEDLVDVGELDKCDVDQFVSTIHTAARAGRFSMALTIFGAVAVI